MTIIIRDAIPKIAEMSPGHFWSRDVIGITEDEYGAYSRGELPPSRVEEAHAEVRRTIAELSEAAVPGASEWMTRRRACN